MEQKNQPIFEQFQLTNYRLLDKNHQFDNLARSTSKKPHAFFFIATSGCFAMLDPSERSA